jgi:uncharacterized membrane protein YfcA
MLDEASRFFIVLLVGAGGQLLDGTLGMGFGVFSASVLLAAGFSPVTVVATVNAAKLLTGIFSGIAHWKAGNVRRDWLLPLIVPGVAGGALGVYLLASLPQAQFRFWMAAVLSVMGGIILYRSLPSTITSLGFSSVSEPPKSSSRSPYLGMLGFAAGFLNAISGAYGPFATSGVILIGRGKPHQAIGTVNVAEIFVAGAVISSLLFEKGLQTVSWDLAIALDLGGALTAPLAAYACLRVPSKVLQVGVGIALICLNLNAVISQFG